MIAAFPTEVIVAFPTVPSDLVEERRDDFSSDRSGWDIILLDPAGTAQYEDGKYTLAMKRRMLYLGFWETEGEIDYNNFAVEVVALGPWGVQGALEQGFVIGWTKDLSSPAYAVTTNSSGTCTFWSRKLNEENWVPEKAKWPPEPGLSISEQELAESEHKLLLVKKDNFLTGYVDGQFCGQFEMDGYQSGFVGLAALGPDAGGKSYFDDFVIYRYP